MRALQLRLNADALNPASQLQMRGAEHELIDMGKVAKALDETQPLRGGKRHSTKKGVCAYAECQGGMEKRPQLRCGSCRDGQGAYYHLGCFFKTPPRH